MIDEHTWLRMAKAIASEHGYFVYTVRDLFAFPSAYVLYRVNPSGNVRIARRKKARDFYKLVVKVIGG